MQYLFLFLLFFTAVFLVLIILVQRGKGGGLAGAFGGMGGQSAFGTKAGDTFTRITVVVAAFWIVLCVVSVKLLGTNTSRMNLGPLPTPKNEAPANPGAAPAKPAAPTAEKPAAEAPAAPAPAKSSEKGK
ncbi:MAG: preprotein translocase subunit SecG [Thermoguttaceae bacterium]|jgi:preprotein translocase subunit SecG